MKKIFLFLILLVGFVANNNAYSQEITKDKLQKGQAIGFHNLYEKSEEKKIISAGVTNYSNTNSKLFLQILNSNKDHTYMHIAAIPFEVLKQKKNENINKFIKSILAFIDSDKKEETFPVLLKYAIQSNEECKTMVTQTNNYLILKKNEKNNGLINIGVKDAIFESDCGKKGYKIMYLTVPSEDLKKIIAEFVKEYGK